MVGCFSNILLFLYPSLHPLLFDIFIHHQNPLKELYSHKVITNLLLIIKKGLFFFILFNLWPRGNKNTNLLAKDHMGRWHDQENPEGNMWSTAWKAAVYPDCAETDSLYCIRTISGCPLSATSRTLGPRHLIRIESYWFGLVENKRQRQSNSGGHFGPEMLPSGRTKTMK